MIADMHIPGVEMLKEQIPLSDPRAAAVIANAERQELWHGGIRYVIKTFIAQGPCVMLTWISERELCRTRN